MYQYCFLVQHAHAVCERAVYSWDNSYKNYKTGAYNINEKDPLYWRVYEDSFFKNFLDKTSNQILLSIKLINKTTNIKRYFDIKKNKALDGIPKNMVPTIIYSRSITTPSITTTLNQVIQCPQLGRNSILTKNKNVHVQATSTIVEPTEFIRNIELAESLSAIFTKKK